MKTRCTMIKEAGDHTASAKQDDGNDDEDDMEFNTACLEDADHEPKLLTSKVDWTENKRLCTQTTVLQYVD